MADDDDKHVRQPKRQRPSENKEKYHKRKDYL